MSCWTISMPTIFKVILSSYTKSIPNEHFGWKKRNIFLLQSSHLFAAVNPFEKIHHGQSGEQKSQCLGEIKIRKRCRSSIYRFTLNSAFGAISHWVHWKIVHPNFRAAILEQKWAFQLSGSDEITIWKKWFFHFVFDKINSSNV